MNRHVLGVVLVLAACGNNNNKPSVDAPPAATRAVVAVPTANLGPPPGVLSTVDIKTLAVDQNVGAQLVGADPLLRHYGDLLYIVNSADGDNITIVDATTLELVDQLGTGASSNPQDVAVVGNKLYVPSLGTTGVVVATRGSSTTTTIDLGTAVGDPDGKPDCVSAFLVGTDLYVACDLLDANFMSHGGKVAVIDTTTDTVRTTFSLPFANPQNFFIQGPASLGGDLLISTAPSFTDYSTGCVARIATGATPTASCLITNQALGGLEGHVALSHDNASLWMAVTAFDPTSLAETGFLKSYSIATQQLAAVTDSSEFIVDVATCPDGSVVAADRTGAGGVRVFSNSVEVTSGELPVGLPPGFGNDIVCY